MILNVLFQNGLIIGAHNLNLLRSQWINERLDQSPNGGEVDRCIDSIQTVQTFRVIGLCNNDGTNKRLNTKTVGNVGNSFQITNDDTLADRLVMSGSRRFNSGNH